MNRHPPAAPGLCVLVDAVCEAPRLLDFLPPEPWTALSATSSTLRQLIHGFTKIISVDTAEDIPALCKRRWPQLALVLIRKDYWLSDKTDAVKGNIQLLSARELAGGTESATVALTVRPKSSRRQTQLAQKKMLSRIALTYFNSPQWNQLTNLRLCHCNLSAKGLA